MDQARYNIRFDLLLFKNLSSWRTHTALRIKIDASNKFHNVNAIFSDGACSLDPLQSLDFHFGLEYPLTPSPQRFGLSHNLNSWHQHDDDNTHHTGLTADCYRQLNKTRHYFFANMQSKAPVVQLLSKSSSVVKLFHALDWWDSANLTWNGNAHKPCHFAASFSYFLLLCLSASARTEPGTEHSMLI